MRSCKAMENTNVNVSLPTTKATLATTTAPSTAPVAMGSNALPAMATTAAAKANTTAKAKATKATKGKATKGKATKATKGKATKAKATAVKRNPWGYRVGSLAAHACAMYARPNGATQTEIVAAPFNANGQKFLNVWRTQKAKHGNGIAYKVARKRNPSGRKVVAYGLTNPIKAA